MRQVRAYREVRVTCARNAASFLLGPRPGGEPLRMWRGWGDIREPSINI